MAARRNVMLVKLELDVDTTDAIRAIVRQEIGPAIDAVKDETGWRDRTVLRRIAREVAREEIDAYVYEPDTPSEQVLPAPVDF